jgi:hypothetical protein
MKSVVVMCGLDIARRTHRVKPTGDELQSVFTDDDGIGVLQVGGDSQSHS